VPIIDWWKRNAIQPSGRKPTYALVVVALVVAVAVGYVAGALAERSRHTATGARVLVGTVMESNEGSHWILFYPDGVVPSPNNGNSMYYLGIADSWVDDSGKIHDGSYPACLVAHTPIDVASYPAGAGPRVELTIIDWDNGGSEPIHIAVKVHCLNYFNY
jgi:hypothetical protein